MKAILPTDLTDLFEPLRPRRVSDEIAQRIRAMILSKKLKPGDRLPSERVLAGSFQVGRVTLREALRILEERGLIQIKKGGLGGAFVATAGESHEDITSIITDNLELDGITLKQISDARQVVAYGVARLSVENATTEDLDEIEAYIQKYETASEPQAIQDLVLKLIHFQNLTAKSSHNPLLIAFTRILAEWSRRKLIHWYPSEDEQMKIIKYHKELFESIKKRDVEHAQLVTRKNLISVNRMYKDKI